MFVLAVVSTVVMVEVSAGGWTVVVLGLDASVVVEAEDVAELVVVPCTGGNTSVVVLSDSSVV